MKIPRELIAKYNQQGPRYTSYPPATFFDSSFGFQHYSQALQESNTVQPSSISLYIHIPFCQKLCTFCGCTTIAKPRDSMDAAYTEALMQEIRNVAALLDLSRPVTQIHWGGGTPHAIGHGYIEQIMSLIKETFTLAPHAEVAMECNPAYFGTEFIGWLQSLGFNRISLGVEDYDPQILKIINRDPSRIPVGELVADIRQRGLKGTNLDFVYGLPGQTVAGFEKTMQQAAKDRPDRLAVFSYAHVPWVKPRQKGLETNAMPSADEKLEMLELATAILAQHGYQSIGMDHFALPDDELSQAFVSHGLHRNFQGYCTRQATGQVYAFGASGISQLTHAYSQNVKDPKEYIALIEAQGFATERGCFADSKDRAVRDVINEIMCNLQADFSQIGEKYGLTGEELWKTTGADDQIIASFEADGLLSRSGWKLELKEYGSFFVRNIAMAFDPRLHEKSGIYSRTI